MSLTKLEEELLKVETNVKALDPTYCNSEQLLQLLRNQITITKQLVEILKAVTK